MTTNSWSDSLGNVQAPAYRALSYGAWTGLAVGGVRPLPQTPHDLKNEIIVAIEEVLKSPAITFLQ